MHYPHIVFSAITILYLQAGSLWILYMTVNIHNQTTLYFGNVPVTITFLPLLGEMALSGHSPYTYYPKAHRPYNYIPCIYRY